MTKEFGSHWKRLWTNGFYILLLLNFQLQWELEGCYYLLAQLAMFENQSHCLLSLINRISFLGNTTS